jgi:lysophospholipase L1-like esterase
MHVIYVFGDSITYGAWDMGASGWAAQLRAYLDSRKDEPTYYFYPLGIHGETTAGLVKRFDNEFDARRRKDDTTYTFIFAYGANDATWLTDQEKFKESLDGYANNITETIRKAKTVTENIFLIDITPVDEERSANLVKRNKSCLNKYVDMYNEKLYEVAQLNSTNIIEVNATFKQNEDSGLFVSDGLHPNEVGHSIILAKVKSSLEPLLNKLESS